MEKVDLSIYFFGDSLTLGFGLDDVNDVYHQVIKRKYHLQNVIGNGVNGSKITKNKTINQDFSDTQLDFLTRVKEIKHNYDLIVLFGGTNDFGFDNLIGNYDINNIHTFSGAYETLITYILNNYPESQLILVTPTPRSDQNIINDANVTLKDYVEVILNLAKKYDLKVIDAFHEFDIDVNNSDILYDGLHPSKYGHQLLANYLASKLFDK